jgi:hypothetical protein
MKRTIVLTVLGPSLLALGSAASAEAGLFQTPSHNISCATRPLNAGRFAVECTVLSEANRRGQKGWAMRARGGVRVLR